MSLPLIHEYWDLEDLSPSDHLVWWYSGLLHWKIYQMSEDWSHKGNKGCARVHQADQSFSQYNMIKVLMFVLKQQRSLQNNTFLFLIPNRNIQASWKMKFLRTRKVSSSSLKFKFPCMNFFQLSHFKVDSKICRTPRENWCRRWHHCCDNFEWNWYNDRSSVLRSRTFVMGWLQRITPVFKTKHLRQMLICRLDKGCQWLDPNVMAGKVFLNF